MIYKRISYRSRNCEAGRGGLGASEVIRAAVEAAMIATRIGSVASGVRVIMLRMVIVIMI